MMWHRWTKKCFIDVVKLGCAVLLTAAPWIFGLDRGNIATWNAWLNGSVIALIAVAALMSEAEWEPETTLGVGLWVALSPYIVGFMQDATATLVHALVGFAIAALAAAKLLVGSGPKTGDYPH
jgi:SPW repeat